MKQVEEVRKVEMDPGQNNMKYSSGIPDARNLDNTQTTQVRTQKTWFEQNRGINGIWLIAGLVDVVLALDFLFHSFGANSIGFARWIFTVGRDLASPFAGIFNTTYAAPGSTVIWADVLAIAIYTLVAFILVKLVGIIGNRSVAG